MPFPRPASGSVRAKITVAVEVMASDIDFVPLTIQSSPSRRAVVEGFPASEPASGSESPMATVASPVVMRRQ